MTTSNLLKLTLAVLTAITATSAFGQSPPADGGTNGRAGIVQSNYRSARFFGEMPAQSRLLSLSRPLTGQATDDFPGLPASLSEFPSGKASDRTIADPFRPKRPDRTDEQKPGHGSDDREELPWKGQDPFIPAPLPVSEQDKESSAIDEVITIRYQNPATVRAIRAISRSQAVQLFSEVSQKIDERSLEPSSYDVRVRRAVRNLTIALNNEAFLDGLGLSADSFQLDGFRNSLGRLTNSVRVQNFQEALHILNTAMMQAPAMNGLTPGVLGFEFTSASIDTLDKFSGLEPADPGLRIRAGKDDQSSDILQEEIVGIGLEVREHADGLIVVKPVRGGPAAEADIRSGDIIRSIDGQDIRGMRIVSSMDLLKGSSGSRMKMRIDRDGSESREYVLTRRIVRVWTVNDARILSGTDTGYFSLSRFSQNSTAEVEQVLNTLHSTGMKSLIVDLRGNPGGLLTTCVDISDQFVPCGIIVSTKGRLRSDDMLQEATYANTWSVPMVVLIDGNSASASEIFAAAIQENKRGLVVGARSYGKGTVQTHFPLSSIQGDLRLTTARFYSPNGRTMSGNGVIPDVGVDDPDGILNGDDVLSEALQIAQGKTVKDLAIASGNCRPQSHSAGRSSSLDDIMDPSYPGMIVL